MALSRENDKFFVRPANTRRSHRHGRKKTPPEFVLPQVIDKMSNTGYPYKDSPPWALQSLLRQLCFCKIKCLSSKNSCPFTGADPGKSTIYSLSNCLNPRCSGGTIGGKAGS
jgi:hypothetical protein